LDTCAYGSASTDDIVEGKSADIDCDNFAETGTLATQTLAVSTDEVKTGVYAATWLSAVDTDLAAGNIRSGFNIFGHEGAFTSDATAAEGNIMSGLTAGVNGTIITGTLATQTLDPANDTVLAGYYTATTLSTVDADLAPGNIAVSTTIFGKVGTYTSDADAIAADILNPKTAYVNGVKLTGTLATQTLDPANDTVLAGYYTATTLSTVDTDLAAGNIAVSTNIFGHLGTYTSDADAIATDILNPKTAYVNGVKITGTVPAGANVSGGEGLKTFTITDGLYSGNKTATANDTDLAAGNIKSAVTIFGVTGTLETAPPAPTVGGTWLLVPGESALGSRDFYVQKYEAKNVASVPTSEPAGFPWVSISQTDAKRYCTALGPGYHLLTMEEAQTINRNIESIASNWTGGAVGSGGLWRGHTDNVPANSLAADVDSSSYTGTGNTWPSIEKRTHQLSSGDIWDWSGNVWEWVDMTCVGGTGTGLWDATVAWQEWDAAALSDYEKGRAGPAGAYTSVQNAGRYYGCTATANAVIRGGGWPYDAPAGVFAFGASNAPSGVAAYIGFRCGR
ncbi:MAG: SUMF1/EgtB/PvdO family nonheme iron enzyme, partial [Elusimicrobia bacterium]|nr:SUMF1/EgtB/PvdO family nonheme iron enzyme [Elusimicrobiota bacterium]